MLQVGSGSGETSTGSGRPKIIGFGSSPLDLRNVTHESWNRNISNIHDPFRSFLGKYQTKKIRLRKIILHLVKGILKRYWSNNIDSWYIGVTVRQRNLDPFIINSYFIKWVNTSWTYSRCLCIEFVYYKDLHYNEI